MPQYSMTPISNGTRLREDHNTFADVITSFNANQVLVGDELWVAPADGPEVKKNDKWLHVTHVDGVPLQEQGWTAYIHKGSPYCDNFQEIGVNPDPDPSPTFPESFVLTDPTGARAEYAFVRVLEDE